MEIDKTKWKISQKQSHLHLNYFSIKTTSETIKQQRSKIFWVTFMKNTRVNSILQIFKKKVFVDFSRHFQVFKVL